MTHDQLRRFNMSEVAGDCAWANNVSCLH